MKMGSAIGLKVKTKQTEKTKKKKKTKQNKNKKKAKSKMKKNNKTKQNTKQAYPRITVCRSEYSVSFPCALLSR